jgi:hypothetical protein
VNTLPHNFSIFLYFHTTTIEIDQNIGDTGKQETVSNVSAMGIARRNKACICVKVKRHELPVQTFIPALLQKGGIVNTTLP